MRVIQSRRNPSTGEMYHSCPKTQGIVSQIDCQRCIIDGAEIEQLPALYRVHCPFGEEVKAIVPSHVEDQIPQSWGTDRFALSQFSVIEPKLDGARCIMKVEADGIRCFSRRNNRFGDQSEFTENVSHIANLRLPGLEGTILDGELICRPNSKGSASGNIPTGTLGATMAVVGSKPEQAIKTQRQSGWAHVYVFDLPKHTNINLTEAPWSLRHSQLERLLESLPVIAKEYIHLMPNYRGGSADTKRKLYQQFFEQGAEGCVLKDEGARYYDLRASLKVKQGVTLDAIVTGWEPGKAGGKYEHTIGVLLYSIKDAATGELVEVGKVVPGSDAVRDEMYQRIGQLTTEQIIGQKIILWLQAQNWTKGYRLRHGRILEYCQDRDTPSTIAFTQIERK